MDAVSLFFQNKVTEKHISALSHFCTALQARVRRPVDEPGDILPCEVMRHAQQRFPRGPTLQATQIAPTKVSSTLIVTTSKHNNSVFLPKEVSKWNSEWQCEM
jgi:hypothetical protein